MSDLTLIRRPRKGEDMAKQPNEQSESAGDIDDGSGVEPGKYGSLSVEDDAAGTADPADLAGTANSDDADVGSQPSVSEADET